MTRPFSPRTFLLQYTVGAATAILLAFCLFHLPRHRRDTAHVYTRLATLERLIAISYPGHSPESFRQWLDQAHLDQWAAPGWNVSWFASDRHLRWTIYPLKLEDLPPAVHDAIEQARDPSQPPFCLQIQHRLRPKSFHVLPLSPGDADAGILLLQASLPRFLLDAIDLWAVSIALISLLAFTLLLYQWRTQRHIQNLMKEAGLDEEVLPVLSTDTFEAWTRRYVAAAVREIAKDRELFDALFELLQDGILLLDSTNGILRANSAAAQMLGRSTTPLSGMRLEDINGHDSLAALVATIRATGLRRSDDILLPGVSDVCRVSGAPLPADQNGSTHLLFVMRDMTQLRRLETAGEEYANNVSHELKTPLTLILGYTETLLSHRDTDEKFRERSLRTIERHTKRIIRIVDDLLRLSWLRNESAIHGIPRTPVDVAIVVTTAADTCREWARSADIAIETNVPDNLIWSLNSGLIEEAIVNLVKNAILYALEGPVEVRARLLPSGSLQISVIDRGPGLQPEDAQRIFDRFYRPDKSRSRASGGSGLGLPIVQQIVEAHNGTARVETAPGAGCTFILEFPPLPDPA